jgi:Cytochrome P450
MFIFPEIAAKVHKEIEDVVGNDRLPTLADRKYLPYTEATWLEGLRWNTSLPIGALFVQILWLFNNRVDSYSSCEYSR